MPLYLAMCLPMPLASSKCRLFDHFCRVKHFVAAQSYGGWSNHALISLPIILVNQNSALRDFSKGLLKQNVQLQSFFKFSIVFVIILSSMLFATVAAIQQEDDGLAS